MLDHIFVLHYNLPYLRLIRIFQMQFLQLFQKVRANAVPKAPMLTAKSSEEPERSEGSNMGRSTLSRIVLRPAPRLCAASIRLQSILLHATVRVRIVLGIRK